MCQRRFTYLIDVNHDQSHNAYHHSLRQSSRRILRAYKRELKQCSLNKTLRLHHDTRVHQTGSFQETRKAICHFLHTRTLSSTLLESYLGYFVDEHWFSCNSRNNLTFSFSHLSKICNTNFQKARYLLDHLRYTALSNKDALTLVLLPQWTIQQQQHLWKLIRDDSWMIATLQQRSDLPMWIKIRFESGNFNVFLGKKLTRYLLKSGCVSSS